MFTRMKLLNPSIILFITGFLLILFGLSVVVGWHIGSPRLTQMDLSLMPISYNSALTFCIFGIALCAFYFDLKYTSILLSIMTIIIAFSHLIQYLTDIDLHIDQFFGLFAINSSNPRLGKMAPNTAICFGLGGIALLALNREWLENKLIAGIAVTASTVIIAISFMALFGYIIGLEAAYEWVEFARIAFSVAAACFLMGLGLFLYEFFTSRKYPQRFLLELPIAIGIGSLTATLVLWKSMDSQEYFKIKKFNEETSEYLQTAFRSVLSDHLEALDRMAVQWNLNSGTPRREWETNVNHYMQDQEGMAQFRVVNANLVNQWIIPPDPTLLNQHLEMGLKSRQILEEAKESNKTLLNNTTPGILFTYTPLLSKNQFDGFMISKIDLASLLHDHLLFHFTHDHSITIFDGQKLVYSNANDLLNTNVPSKIVSQFPLHIDSVDWVMKVSPTSQFVTKQKSFLPSFVLYLGTILSLLASLASYFARQNFIKKGIAENAVKDLKATIEELNITHKKAEQANLAKSMFLATMSHEIRTPLHGIIGNISMLADTPPLNDKQKKYVDRITLSSKLLLGIINDILDFSKIEAGELRLEFIPVYFPDVIKEVVDEMRLKAENKGLEFIVHYTPETSVKVLTDPLRIKQILTNLIENAIKFTEKGHILISLRCLKQTSHEIVISVEVKDTGVGVSPANYDQLFKKFSQVDMSTTRKFGGTGLGLAICKQLVELFGGTIGFTSKENEGSSFFFTIPFPLNQKGLEDASHKQLLKTKKAPSHFNILIIDDSELNCQILEDYLQKWSIKNQVSSDSTEAMRILIEAVEQLKPFDIALVDFNMPRMDGFEFAKVVRENEKLKNMILILLSSTEKIPTDIKAHGYDAYLLKPIYPNDLYETIIASLSEKKSDLKA